MLRNFLEIGATSRRELAGALLLVELGDCSRLYFGQAYLVGYFDTVLHKLLSSHACIQNRGLLNPIRRATLPAPRPTVPSSLRLWTADFFANTPFSSCYTSPPSLRSSTSTFSLHISSSASQASSPPHYSTALTPDQNAEWKSIIFCCSFNNTK